MKQSKRMSLLESAINIAVGFGIALGAQIVFLPLLGVAIELHQNIAFAVIMTIISLCRQFILRRLFEALHIRTPLSPAMLAVIAERRRQIDTEGWSTEHDDAHVQGELATAGAAYLISAGGDYEFAASLWPWQESWWKPDAVRPRRDLVRGIALGIAELEKFDRTKKTKRTIMSSENNREIIGDGAWSNTPAVYPSERLRRLREIEPRGV